MCIKRVGSHQGLFLWPDTSKTKTRMLNAIIASTNTPAGTIRRTPEGVAKIITNPNNSMMDATAEATADSVVSSNCLRRISCAESSILPSSLRLLSQNNQAKELGKAQGWNHETDRKKII